MARVATAPLFGAHVSTAGGVGRAFERAAYVRATAMQIFVKSPAQWRGPELTEAVAAAFRGERSTRRTARIVAHAGYLINLAAPDAATLLASRAALADELRRTALLGLDALIVHPGAHRGAGAIAGLARAAESIAEVLADPTTQGPRLLLENTADSMFERGARRDRHANLGKGRIGRDFFARLVNDPRFGGLPLLVETPSPPDLSAHRRDVAMLRRAWRG